MSEATLSPIPRKPWRPRRRKRLGPILRVIAWAYVVMLVGALCSLFFVGHDLTQTKIGFAIVESLFVALLALSIVIAVRAKTPGKRGVGVGCAVAVVSAFIFAHTILPYLAFAAVHADGELGGIVQARSQIPFDAEEWRENDTPFWSLPIRYRMAEDLINQRVLIGKTASEVEEILGRRDYSHHPFDECDTTYVLKPTFMDHLWVAITLDESGRVESARIRED